MDRELQGSLKIAMEDFSRAQIGSSIMCQHCPMFQWLDLGVSIPL